MPSSRGGRPPGGSRVPPSAVLEVIAALFRSVLARHRLEHPGFVLHPDVERDFSWFCQVSLPTHPDAAYEVFLDLVEAVEEDPFGQTVHPSAGLRPAAPPPRPRSAEPAPAQTGSLAEDIEKALAAHDKQHVAPAVTVPPPPALPSIQMLVSLLATRPLDEFRGLDSEYIGLLQGLFMCTSSLLDLPAVDTASSPRSGFAPALPAPTPPAAVQSAEQLTKPTTPPPRPPRSPTRPPTHPIKAKKPSYAATAAAASSAALPPPARAPVSKTAALRKSCIKQGTKATKVILRFPSSFQPPTVIALKTALAAFKPSDIALTLRGDFVLTFSQVLDSDDHATLAKKLKKVYSVDIQVLNRGTTSLLKCPLVPTQHPDGSAVTNEWLHQTISHHPRWKSVEFVQKPRFIVPTGKQMGFTATVFTEVSDDHAASTAKHLLQTDILFDSVPRRCKPWSVSVSAKQCGICLRWGHSSHHCSSKSAWCTVCAGNHESSMHVAAARADAKYDIIKCANCTQEHWATARVCPFYKACFDTKELAVLQQQRLDRVREARRHRPRLPRNTRFHDEELSEHGFEEDEGLY